MLSITHSSLQERIESIQPIVELELSTGRAALGMLFGSALALFLVSIAIASIKASPAQRWLSMTVSWIVVGVATIFITQHNIDENLEERHAAIAHQDAIVQDIRDDIHAQYDVIDATPILQRNTTHDKDRRENVSRLTKGETVEPWLQHIAQYDPFNPALVSVILPETHENAVYALEFSEDGETVVLNTLPDSDEAPPVEEITR